MENDIIKNLVRIKHTVAEAAAKYRNHGDEIRIMAVTKTVLPEYVNIAVSEGVKLLGENRVQEFLSKREFYDSSAEIHFIGHLQTNKVRQIIDKVKVIQSVDSLRLAEEIDRQAAALGIVMDILCEVNIGDEDSKFGVSPRELEEMLRSISGLRNIHVKGLMAIPPPFGSDSEKLLHAMHELFTDMSDKAIHGIDMDILSTGMSGDYETAVKHGSNLIRIGSALFGQR